MTKNKQYYVDFYDMFDGWGGWGFSPERLFDSLPKAQKCRDKLNSELDIQNISAGEHWGIIDGLTKTEIECPLERTYTIKK